MAINKVEFDNRVLIDLTLDTVDEKTVISGTIFHKPNGDVATGENTNNADTSADTVTEEDVKRGVTFHKADGSSAEGTMPYVSATKVSDPEIPLNIDIASKDDKWKIEKGYLPSPLVVGTTMTGVDVSDTTAIESTVLKGWKFHNKDGNLVEGNIPTITPIQQPFGTINLPLDTKNTKAYFGRGYLPQPVTVGLGESATNIVPENIKKDVYILGTVGTLEEGKPMTLLWENDEFNQNFVAQTVELDLSNYEGVVILFTNTTSSNYITKQFIYKNTSYRCFPAFSATATSGSILNRLVTVTESGVEFAIGRSGTSTGNANMIPVAIYGVTSETSSELIKVGSSISKQLGVSNYEISYNEDGTFNASWNLSYVSGYEGIALPILVPRYAEANNYRISMSVKHTCTVATGTTRNYWGLAIGTSNELQTQHTVSFGETGVETNLSIDFTSSASTELMYYRPYLIFSMGGVTSGGGTFEVKNVKIEPID